ncbi:MAG: type II toxin-antitoxin system HicA family toxin [Candidatus Xenobiia bacterium LiM19]
MVKFPSMKSKKMRGILERSPLNYSVAHRVGSHCKYVSASGYPDIRYTYHDKDTLSGSTVRDILVDMIGLSETEALNLI